MWGAGGGRWRAAAAGFRILAARLRSAMGSPGKVELTDGQRLGFAVGSSSLFLSCHIV
jgi:hypothetical protein